MPDKIIHLRNLIAGSKPTTSSLGVGELAINVNDGKIYIRQSGSLGDSIQTAVTTNNITTGSITISGSLIVTGSLNALNITGSLFGTSSWASNAVTASYINPANIIVPTPFQIATGSVTASVDVIANTIFLIKSGSRNLFKVDNTGSISASGSLTLDTTGSYDKLVSVNNNGVEYFKITGSGVLALNQFAIAPDAIAGGIFISTSGDFYFGT